MAGPVQGFDHIASSGRGGTPDGESKCASGVRTGCPSSGNQPPRRAAASGSVRRPVDRGLNPDAPNGDLAWHRRPATRGATQGTPVIDELIMHAGSLEQHPTVGRPSVGHEESEITAAEEAAQLDSDPDDATSFVGCRSAGLFRATRRRARARLTGLKTGHDKVPSGRQAAGPLGPGGPRKTEGVGAGVRLRYRLSRGHDGCACSGTQGPASAHFESRRLGTGSAPSRRRTRGRSTTAVVRCHRPRCCPPTRGGGVTGRG